MNKPNASLYYSVLAVTAIVGSFFSPYLSVANGQSPPPPPSSPPSTGMMNGNEIGMGQNMSIPQSNLGIVTMPVTCTSLGEILRSVTGTTGGGDNESQKNIMDMMQKMMSGGGIGNNMTGTDMQDLQQGVGQPQQGVGQPQQGVGQPQQGVGQPQQGVGQPQQGVGQPQQGVGQPQQGVGQPQQGVGQPQQGVGQPQQGVGQPQQGMQGLKQLDLQGILNMQLCSLMTNQTMMEEMLTVGGNATGGSMPPPSDSSGGMASTTFATRCRTAATRCRVTTTSTTIDLYLQIVNISNERMIVEPL